MNIDAIEFQMHLYRNLVKYSQFFKNLFSQIKIKNYDIDEVSDFCRLESQYTNYYLIEQLWQLLYRLQIKQKINHKEFTERFIEYKLHSLDYQDQYVTYKVDGFIKLFNKIGELFYNKNPSFKLYEKFQRIGKCKNSFGLCFGAAHVNNELKYLFMNFQYDLIDNKRIKNLHLKVFNTDDDVFKVYQKIL